MIFTKNARYSAKIAPHVLILAEYRTCFHGLIDWRIATGLHFIQRNTRTVPKLCANESVEMRLLLKTENSNLILRRVNLRRNLRWDSGISVSSSMQYPSECCPFIKTFSYICKSGGFSVWYYILWKCFFRKSSNENVEVFLIRRMARNDTHFRVGTWG